MTTHSPCQKCGNHFNRIQIIDGVRRRLYARKFCLSCSPFNSHNTKDLTKFPKELVIGVDHKTCHLCTVSKPIEQFHKSKSHLGGRQHICKCCSHDTQMKRLKLAKFLAVQYRGGRCQICGYDKCIDALDFHHLDPDEKDFSFSERRATALDRGRLKQSIKTELDKCQLVCSNCHREIHFNHAQARRPKDGHISTKDEI